MRYVLLALLLSLSAAPAFAAYTGPLANAPTSTVKDVLSGSDDAKMCLEGHVVSKKEGSTNKYTFEDATGTLVVEIKDKVFGTQSVDASTKVRICGEVDSEFRKNNEFDAKTLQVLR